MNTVMPLAAGDAVVDGVDVDAVAAAVRGCPGVQDLYGGPPELTVTYLPGRRVEGVRIDPQAVVVQVRARWGASVSDLATQICAALDPLAPGRRIDIMWADVADPPPPAPTPATTYAATPAPETGVLWTSTNAGRAGGSSSERTTRTVVATRPPSSAA